MTVVIERLCAHHSVERFIARDGDDDYGRTLRDAQRAFEAGIVDAPAYFIARDDSNNAVVGYAAFGILEFRRDPRPTRHRKYVFVPSAATSDQAPANTTVLLFRQSLAWRDAVDPSHTQLRGVVCIPLTEPVREMLVRAQFVPGPDPAKEYMWRPYADFRGVN